MDYNAMRLRCHGDAQKMDEILQLECRDRATSKLPSFLACPDFRFPSLLAAEQATSESLARYHASLVPEGACVLDMTCGLGIDAFTIASRASTVTALEIDRNKAECAAANAEALGLKNVEVINADSTDFIKNVDSGIYDVVFIDPARREQSTGKRTFALADCTPDITAIYKDLLKITPLLLIKASPMLDISRIYAEIGGQTAEIHVVGTSHECRELLILVRDGYSGPLTVKAATILGDRTVITRHEDSKPLYADTIKEGDFIYEPWPAVMKAGMWGTLCHRYNVRKVSIPTNLFLSSQQVDEFPGPNYRVIAISGMSKRELSEIRSKFPEINVASRGVGIAAAELKKKLKVKDVSTDSRKLFGVILPTGQRGLVVAEKID